MCQVDKVGIGGHVILPGEMWMQSRSCVWWQSWELPRGSLEAGYCLPADREAGWRRGCWTKHWKEGVSQVCKRNIVTGCWLGHISNYRCQVSGMWFAVVTWGRHHWVSFFCATLEASNPWATFSLFVFTGPFLCGWEEPSSPLLRRTSVLLARRSHLWPQLTLITFLKPSSPNTVTLQVRPYHMKFGGTYFGCSRDTDWRVNPSMMVVVTHHEMPFIFPRCRWGVKWRCSEGNPFFIRFDISFTSRRPFFRLHWAVRIIYTVVYGVPFF